MAITREQFNQLFSVVREQLESMSKEQIIKQYLDTYYELSSELSEIKAQRVRGAAIKHAETNQLKKIFRKTCVWVVNNSEIKRKRLRFSDIRSYLNEIRPEIEWLSAGKEPVEASAKKQYKRSVKISKWLAEINNEFASKGDISE